MKAFKAFIKPFEAPPTGMKKKILVNFFSSPETFSERVLDDDDDDDDELFLWYG